MTTENENEPVQTNIPGLESPYELIETDWNAVIKAKAAEQAKQRAMLATGPQFISFKGGHLSIDKVPIPGDKLDVVVLTFIAENTYYKGKFDATKTQMPVCYAVYNSHEDMWPNAADVKEVQSDDCASCRHYQWGSDPAGGRGKACKTRYRIGIIPAPSADATDEDVLSSELRFATIPVTSCKGFEQYMSRCELLHGRPMFGLVSEVAVTPNEKTLYEVKFTPVAPISGPMLQPIMKRIEEAEKNITYEYSLEDEVEDKPLK
jgi:hypothetical protein